MTTLGTLESILISPSSGWRWPAPPCSVTGSGQRSMTRPGSTPSSVPAAGPRRRPLVGTAVWLMQGSLLQWVGNLPGELMTEAGPGARHHVSGHAAKVFNMVGIVGVLRSGDVNYSIFIDIVGMWCIGLPLLAWVAVSLLGWPPSPGWWRWSCWKSFPRCCWCSARIPAALAAQSGAGIRGRAQSGKMRVISMTENPALQYAGPLQSGLGVRRPCRPLCPLPSSRLRRRACKPQKERITETALLEMANKDHSVNTRTSSTACAPTRWSRRGHSGVQGEFFLAEDGTPTGRQDHGGVHHVRSCWPSSSPATPWPRRRPVITGMPPQAASVLRPASPAGFAGLGHHAVVTRHLGHVEAPVRPVEQILHPRQPLGQGQTDAHCHLQQLVGGGAFHQPRLHRDPQPLRPLWLVPDPVNRAQDGKLLAVTPGASMPGSSCSSRVVFATSLSTASPPDGRGVVDAFEAVQIPAAPRREPVCGSWRPRLLELLSSAGGGSSCRSARPW